MYQTCVLKISTDWFDCCMDSDTDGYIERYTLTGVQSLIMKAVPGLSHGGSRSNAAQMEALLLPQSACATTPNGAEDVPSSSGAM
jgi:hypothetical protein